MGNWDCFKWQLKIVDDAQLLILLLLEICKVACINTIILRWLKTVFSTFQDLDFDESLQPLFISLCYNHGIKKLPNQ